MSASSSARRQPSTLPVSAELCWRAPVDDFFLDPVVAQGRELTELLPLIEGDLQTVLQERPSIEAVEEHYNLCGSIEVTVDGQVVNDALDESLDGQRRVEIIVAINGQMVANNGPGALRSWNYDEILTELAAYSDLYGQPERFVINIRPCR